jgi:hypothetical protein
MFAYMELQDMSIDNLAYALTERLLLKYLAILTFSTIPYFFRPLGPHRPRQRSDCDYFGLSIRRSRRGELPSGGKCAWGQLLEPRTQLPAE